MKETGASIIVRLLERKGIKVVSGIPGGANLPLYDALYGSNIRHVLARHEQGAGFIAQGMARSTGQAAVCIATSGPGATNLLTAIADAKMDSVPLVAFTGQVSSKLIGTDAFQEVDTYGLTIPITKHNFLVHSARELLDVVPLAFYLAESGRPGPVLIDVPKDVQLQEIEVKHWPPFLKPDTRKKPDEAGLMAVAEKLNAAERPLMLIGAGVAEAESTSLVRQMMERLQIPVACTLRGLGIVSPTHPLNLGMIGMHGTQYANQLIEEADVVLALGVRFDDRATGDVRSFCRMPTLIHVDIDKAEIDKIKPSHLSLEADLQSFLKQVYPLLHEQHRPIWCERIAELKNAMPFVPLPSDADVFHPIRFIRDVASQLPEDAIITTDVGQHQMWVAQAYPFAEPRTFLTSSGLGTMGFGLPAAIGAALAHPDRRVVCFSGDGSLLMNIQELATLAELRVPVTILLFNNGHLGLVRQQQTLFFERHYMASAFQGLPDFPAIARGFGIQAFDLSTADNPAAMLAEALSANVPTLVNVPIDPDALVMPMVPPGGSNQHMLDQY